MGYYSSLAINLGSYSYDVSYTAPEQQLLWRLDDLYDQISELPFIKHHNLDRAIFSLNDYRYAPVKCFETFGDVNAAIHIAIDDLKNKYGIDVSEEFPKYLVEETPIEQLTLFDNITLPCCVGLQQAA